MTPEQFGHLNDLGVENPVALIEKLYILAQYQAVGFENLPVPMIDVTTRHNTRIRGQLVMMKGQSIIVRPDEHNNNSSFTIFYTNDIVAVSVHEIEKYMIYLMDIPYVGPKIENLAFQQQTTQLLNRANQKTGIIFSIKTVPDHITWQTIQCIDVYLQAMAIAIAQLKKEYTLSGMDPIDQGQIFLNPHSKTFEVEVIDDQLRLFLPDHLVHVGSAVKSIHSAIEKVL